MSRLTTPSQTVAGFERLFRRDADPWGTHVHRDEAVKRAAIVRALPRRARVLELGCGNGSNSRAIAERALRLVALDGSARAVELTRERVAGLRADVVRGCLPDAVPPGPFDAVVAAEVLYYLDAREIAALAGRLGRALVPGGLIVLAHHHVDFDDTATRPADVHGHLLAGLRGAGRAPGALEVRARTRRWRVERVVVA